MRARFSTIARSARSLQEFSELLRAAQVGMGVDVRTFPGPDGTDRTRAHDARRAACGGGKSGISRATKAGERWFDRKQDVMSVERILQLAIQRLVTIQTDATVAEAAERLCEPEKALLVVCDPAGVMRGVITKTDIVRQVARSQGDLVRGKSADIMTKDVTYCTSTDSLRGVLTMMKDQGLVHIPVVDGDHRPTGVVNARDALQVLFSELREEELLLREYVMGIGYR